MGFVGHKTGHMIELKCHLNLMNDIWMNFMNEIKIIIYMDDFDFILKFHKIMSMKV